MTSLHDVIFEFAFSMAVQRRAKRRRVGKLIGSRAKSRAKTLRRRGRIGYSKFGVRKSVPLYRNVEPFPNAKLVRHRYCENVTIGAGAAGALVNYIFGANDMYDPNNTGVGHQPMFRDEMAAKYTKYTVIASFIKVSFAQTPTVQSNYGILVSDDPSPFTSARTQIERDGYNSALSKVTPPMIPSNRNYPIVLKQYFDAKKWFKTSFKGLMADDVKNTLSGNSPSLPVYYHIWAQPYVSADVQPDTRIQVEITYVTMWRQPMDFVES